MDGGGIKHQDLRHENTRSHPLTLQRWELRCRIGKRLNTWSPDFQAHVPSSVFTWKELRGKYGQVCPLRRPGPRHADLLLTKDGK